MSKGFDECIACGGSGLSSKGEACTACRGTGSFAPRTPVQHLSGSVEHFTPIDIVEAARAVLGTIDVDPASCSLANAVVKAKVFYGEQEDGLKQKWSGKVFLNPPGGTIPEEYRGIGTRSNAALWWGALASAWQVKEVESAIFIGFSLELLRSAQALVVPQPMHFPLCVPSSRIAFDREEDGKRVESKSPTNANVIVYLPPSRYREITAETKWAGKASTKFAKVFGEIGVVRL